MQYCRRRVCIINIQASHVSRLYIQLSEDGSNFFESVLQVSIEDPRKFKFLYWIHHSSLIIRVVTYFTCSFKLLVYNNKNNELRTRNKDTNVHVSRMSHLHYHKHAMNNEWYRQVSINSTVYTVHVLWYPAIKISSHSFSISLHVVVISKCAIKSTFSLKMLYKKVSFSICFSHKITQNNIWMIITGINDCTIVKTLLTATGNRNPNLRNNGSCNMV